MQKFRTLFITSVSALCLTACTQAAHNDIKPIENNPLPAKLSSELAQRLKARPEAETKRIDKFFKDYAKDNVVTASQIQDLFDEDITQRRLNILTNLLSIDTNADGNITAKEMLLTANSQALLWQNASRDYIPYDAADTNSDDVISLNESFLFAQKQAQILGPMRQSYTNYLMVFDTNKDGSLTREELDEELKSLNQDLYLSPKAETAQNSNIKESLKPPPKICTPSQPRKGDEVIFVSGYEGSGISSVAVTGLNDTTEVARLVIEKGTTPLYIVASSRKPMIWSIEGDSQRVKTFVTGRNRQQTGAGVGVIGLDENKVEFLGRNCLTYFTGKEQSKVILAKSKWGNLIGKAPDYTVGTYTINSMKLPSGENASKRKKNLTIISGDTEIQLDGNNIIIPKQNRSDKDNDFGVYTHTIEGLITIDPKDVIAPEPVQTYDVFPREAGIAQLVKAGQLIPLEKGSFKIVKPIARFPAGLTSKRNSRFILGENIPVPKGSAGRSSIYSEATGECLSRRCR